MASIQKRPNGKWRARYRDDAGREHARHFDRKTGAQRWLAEVSASRLTGQYVDPRAGMVMFRDYADAWRAAQPHRPATAKHTEKHLRVHINPMLGNRRLSSLRRADVQRLVTTLADTLAPLYVRTVFNTLRAVLNAAVRDRALSESPADGVKLPDMPRRRVVPLTVDQVAALAAAMPDRYRALPVVCAGTGLRAGELFGLTWSAVDFGARLVHVTQQVQQKPGGKAAVAPLKTRESLRAVPLPDVVAQALTEHLTAFPAGPDGFVFTDPAGGPVVATRFGDSAWRPARVQAGVPACTLHQLRHTYASLLIERGASVRLVSSALGHASAKLTLDTYAHLWPDSDDTTRAAVDAAFSATPADSVRTAGGALRIETSSDVVKPRGSVVAREAQVERAQGKRHGRACGECSPD